MEAIALEPVDALTVTTLVDNVTDSLLADQGPAKRPSMAASPRMPARLLAGGDTDDAPSSCSATVIGTTSPAWTGWWAKSGARTCPS